MTSLSKEIAAKAAQEENQTQLDGGSVSWGVGKCVYELLAAQWHLHAAKCALSSPSTLSSSSCFLTEKEMQQAVKELGERIDKASHRSEHAWAEFRKKFSKVENRPAKPTIR